MERRHFLKVALGFAAGAATVATTMRAQAAPLPPMPTDKIPPLQNETAEPAVTSQDEIARLEAEEVKGGRGRGGDRGRGFGRGRGGGRGRGFAFGRWRRRYWRPRYYGWRRRRWGWRRRRWF